MSGHGVVLRVEIKGTLRDAIERLHAELEVRDDVFDQPTAHEIVRRLLAHGLREQMAGRGPWPK